VLLNKEADRTLSLSPQEIFQTWCFHVARVEHSRLKCKNALFIFIYCNITFPF